jgi:hypothetical protein
MPTRANAETQAARKAIKASNAPRHWHTAGNAVHEKRIILQIRHELCAPEDYLTRTTTMYRIIAVGRTCSVVLYLEPTE